MQLTVMLTIEQLPDTHIDERGAILVPAVVMGALLVGALYYVAAIGDAVIFRTQLQDAADATAFKSAVWHARGMNIIVVLNVIMSIAMGIFALLRMVEVVVLVLCLIPPLFPFCFPLFRTLVTSTERTVFNFVDPAINVAHGLQGAASQIVPWVAFGDAKGTPTYAETIWPISLSMLPNIPIPAGVASKLPANAGRPRMPEKGFGALPVQEDEFGTLCSKGFTLIPKQLAALLGDAPFIGGKLEDASDAILNDMARKVFGAGDGILCQPAAGMLAQLIEFLGEQMCSYADSRTEQEQDSADQRENDENNRDRARPRGAAAPTGGSCLDVLASTIGELGEKYTFHVSTADMWAPAANGSPTTHVWSYAEATPRMWQTDQKGVGTAARGKTPEIGEVNASSASGEYYFDCAAGWEHACQWDAMWAPAWTGRLRRYRSPVREMQDVGLSLVDVTLDEFERPFEEIVGEKAGEAFHDATGLPAEGPVAGLVTAFMESFPLSDMYNNSVQSSISSARDRSKIDQFLNQRNHAEQNEVH
jgi:hypothetical protein